MNTGKRSLTVIACVLGILLGMLLTFALHGVQPSYAVETTTAAKAERADAIAVQNAFTSVADELKPSVVFISAQRTNTAGGAPDLDDLFRGWPFGPVPRRSETQRVAGSGFIVTSDGYVMTNDHVVGGADRVTVRLDDGREFTGKVLRDTRTDLALVKIDAKGLPAVKWADSDKVKVGQWAIAFGSPFRLANSVTVGVVSAVTREAEVPDPSIPEGGRAYYGLIQTDAPINPGNSGGPLVNIYGEVIGINAVIESPSGANAGVGFSIPSDTAKFVMDQLVAHGKVVRGYLGLIPKDITPQSAKTLGTDKGALVDSVDDDTPAGKAGIKLMDVIVEIGGKKTDDAYSLRRIVAETKPGTKVPIVIVRDGKRQTVQVTMGQVPDETAKSPSEDKTKVGLTVQDLTAEMVERLGIEPGTTGVLVRSVDASGAAARAKPPIVAGDVIIKINSQAIKNAAQFNKAVAELKSGDTALVVLQRRNRTTISEMTID